MEQNQDVETGLEEEVVVENATTETEDVVTEPEPEQEQEQEQEKDVFDIDEEFLNNIKLDDDEEEIEQTKEVSKQKDAEAFKNLRLNLETKEKETVAERNAKLELEEKLDLIAQNFADTNENFGGDKEKAKQVLLKMAEEQSLKLKGVTPEVAKKLQSYEEQIKQYQEKEKQTQAQAEEQQKMSVASNKIESFKKAISTSNEELGKALKLYEKVTGIDIFSNIDTFNKASDYVLKQAVSLYRKKINPNLVNKTNNVATKPKQIPDNPSEEERLKQLARQMDEELDKRYKT